LIFLIFNIDSNDHNAYYHLLGGERWQKVLSGDHKGLHDDYILLLWWHCSDSIRVKQRFVYLETSVGQFLLLKKTSDPSSNFFHDLKLSVRSLECLWACFHGHSEPAPTSPPSTESILGFTLVTKSLGNRSHTHHTWVGK
jgi:hypothetical protein